MFETVTYEVPADRVARISLNRPEARNAQDTKLLYELNDAFDMAARDDAISVIVLAANGPHFSSGHDLREADPIGSLGKYETVGTWCGFSCEGAEGWMAREKELYQGLSERWRNIPKPTIAQVQGKCIAGGLMLVWPCDLIVASEDALFSDNTVSMGMTGVEFFGHPWELGPRKAKEMLFTSDFVTAQDAHRLGMVNQVVPAAELATFTLELASKIAAKPLFALKLAKEAVNAAEDAQGRISAMQTAFALHQLGHSHNMQVHGLPIDPRGAGGLVEAPKR
ncbi:enoyl-CoA hydratase [Novosphingobium sp. JCM 18896]|uniref:enoyl-CoA hydratase n=1 Tax=Novosphingobium sp. JCM 18896 TaxID=2989731 RepID=UPI002223563A|nr:enoyl-CoA hydratase [Novosphingobium sp. JCM 18896]MCW1432400.1 enoyl-CoA hydratase [Novosphingobium sp. JCM 18896]